MSSARQTWRWLSLDVLQAVHAEQLAEHGGLAGLRDAKALESALARAEQLAHYGSPDGAELAAAYGFGIARYHPFSDGNKRTALAACLVFLQINDALPDPDLPGRDIDAWEELVTDVAASREDRAGLSKRLKALLRKKVGK